MEPCPRSTTQRTTHVRAVSRHHTAIAGVAALIGIGLGFSGGDLLQDKASAAPSDTPRTPAVQEAAHGPVRIGDQGFVTSDLGVAEAGRPATRSPVRPVLTDEKLPADLSATIEAMVTTDRGCTLTRVGDTMITAAHCHPYGFTVEGDIAWDGAEPAWVAPALIPIGATIYAVGYPQASPGPQTFTLANLGLHTVTVEGASVEVLMAVGDGVPCTTGSSGMVAWVTVDNEMVPIGPMSVYSVDPAVTGLPAGQYVCGFAV